MNITVTNMEFQEINRIKRRSNLKDVKSKKDMMDLGNKPTLCLRVGRKDVDIVQLCECLSTMLI